MVLYLPNIFLSLLLPCILCFQGFEPTGDAGEEPLDPSAERKGMGGPRRPTSQRGHPQTGNFGAFLKTYGAVPVSGSNLYK